MAKQHTHTYMLSEYIYMYKVYELYLKFFAWTCVCGCVCERELERIGETAYVYSVQFIYYDHI